MQIATLNIQLEVHTLTVKEIHAKIGFFRIFITPYF